MNQKVRRHKIFTYIKTFIVLFIFIPLLLTSCFLLITPSTNADEAVSATVPPGASNFQFTFTSDGQTNVPQNTTLSYTITYGAQPSAEVSTNTTIVADFSNDKAPDNSDVLDYVIGSASNAYNNTQPVVDLTNRTITWNISNLPAGTTNQTVTFQLKTNSNYTGINPVNFTIRAEMSNQYVTLPDQTVNQTYQFNQSGVTPTPTPTQIPTPTPTPGPGPTAKPNLNVPTATPPIPSSFPTPSSTPSSPPQITNISIPTISQSGATIQVNTNTPSKLTVSYGTSPNALDQTVSTNQYAETSIVTLTKLNQNTTYYFRISATDISGQTITSEIFEFETAKQSPLIQTVNGTAVLTSNGNVMLSESVYPNSPAGFALLPDNTDYNVTVTLSQPFDLTSLVAIEQDQLPLATVAFVQKQPGVYVAHLKTFDPGMYQLFLKTTDANGNVNQQKIADIKVILPLTVYEKDSGDPINNARLFLSYYDIKTNSYQLLSEDFFGNIPNPSYTDAFGQVNLILPPGKYQVNASALFYDGQTIDFTLGPLNGQEFPKIYLKKDPLNMLSLLTYTKDLFIDTFDASLKALHTLVTSAGFFTVAAVTITGDFVLLGYLLFFLKSHITFKNLPLFILFSIDVLLKRHKQKYIFGQITDAQNNPLTRVRIEIEDAQTRNILLHGESHKTGRFYFKNSFGDSVKLIFTKEGYEPIIININNQTPIPATGLHIKLTTGTPHHGSILSHFLAGFEEGWGMLFETFLVMSIILEVLFFLWYGFEKTIPFFVLSLINIILWLFYLREHSAKRI